ncbi:Hypothetical predicted protein [Paramuricea clavata]|uniref:Uncharacterized protein n=1 Tax=Paramuricea clavata TaxID=317549 RepID=A0A7D9E717_PARCT|nr:Hypothetical predicted protein [Paramuricea clavata]
MINRTTIQEELEQKRIISKNNHDETGPQHNTLQPSQHAYAKPPQQQCGKPWNYGEITEEEPTRSYTIRTTNGITRRIESRSHQHHHHQVQELILIKEQPSSTDVEAIPIILPSNPPKKERNNHSTKGIRTIDALGRLS